MSSAPSAFPTPTERLAAFFDGAQPRTTFEDPEIDEIALLLQQCGHVASKCPRTYIVFRTIGQLDTLEELVKVGFCDQWFPVEARSLPSFLELSVKAAVVEQQGIILTKSLDLENGRHRHFAPEEALPFEILGRLGSGGYGQVDRILSRISFRQYALKRIRRRAAFGNSSFREAVNGFLNEMKVLKSLEHGHIVKYVGSYTDKSYLGLVMAPVAECDLATYNERLCGLVQAVQTDGIPPAHAQHHPTVAEMSINLRSYFGCLTAALQYLHEQNIRHKDIKPQNCLVSKGQVLFTDFGLSRNFADDVGSTTSGLTPASPRYCAPEVAAYKARNTSSDIWSLGCVFLEMLTALQGLNVEWIKEYFTRKGSHATHFHANHNATTQLIRELKATADQKNKRALVWIEKMLLFDRKARPKAEQVLEMITFMEAGNPDTTANTFCGICCVPDVEPDSIDSLADDFDTITPIARPDSDLEHGMGTRPEVRDREVVTDNAVNRPAGVEPQRQPSSESEAPVIHPVPIRKDQTPTKSFVLEELDSSGQSVVKRLLKMGVTYAQIEEYAQFVRLFIEQKSSSSLGKDHHDKVFGVPIWISIHYAKTKRSTRKDFRSSIDVKVEVPIIIAECCTLMSAKYLEDDDEYFSRGLLHNVKHVQWMTSIFDSHLTYGSNYHWSEFDEEHAGDLLQSYLSSLPEALIPASIATKLRHLGELPLPTFRVPADHPLLASYITTLHELPSPNRDTLMYLLGFFKSRRGKHVDDTYGLPHRFDPGILAPFSDARIQRYIIRFMIWNAGHILRDHSRYQGNLSLRQRICDSTLRLLQARSPVISSPLSI